MKQMWQRIPYLLMLVAGVVACAPVQPRDPEISKPVTMEMPEIAAPAAQDTRLLMDDGQRQSVC